MGISWVFCEAQGEDSRSRNLLSSRQKAHADTIRVSGTIAQKRSSEAEKVNNTEAPKMTRTVTTSSENHQLSYIQRNVNCSAEMSQFTA